MVARVNLKLEIIVDGDAGLNGDVPTVGDWDGVTCRHQEPMLPLTLDNDQQHLAAPIVTTQTGLQDRSLSNDTFSSQRNAYC